MKLAVIDCETTGTGPDAELLELAVVVVEWDEKQYVFRKTGATLVDIKGVIPPEASAVHHITKPMLKDAVPRAHAREWILDKVMGCEAIAAHFAEFDRQFLPELHHLPWLCTMVIAKHIWPEAPTYGLQVLRYWQALPAEDARSTPHRAIYDAMCAAHLLARQVEVVSKSQHPSFVSAEPVARLLELTQRIPILRVCHFGKHRGTPWGEVPQSYLRWVLDKSDYGQDREIAHTVRHYLRG